MATLSACGTGEPANNVVDEDLNAMMNLDEPPQVENRTEESVETPATEAAPMEKAKPAPAEPAPAKPKPAEPKSAGPKPVEPKAPATDCPPEHRAAGHC
jgi:hypothetical protein